MTAMSQLEAELRHAQSVHGAVQFTTATDSSAEVSHGLWQAVCERLIDGPSLWQTDGARLQTVMLRTVAVRTFDAVIVSLVYLRLLPNRRVGRFSGCILN